MNFSQKKFSNNLFFEFFDETLKFTLKEKGSRNTFEVNYGAIPLEYNELEERNEWFRNVGLLWLAIGIFQKIVIYMQHGKIKASFWFGLGIICLLVYKYVRTKYSVYQTERGNIFVIQDKDHDTIVGEMHQRRKRQLLSWYGEINTENDPTNEIEKFKWLESQGVITKLELQEKISEISKIHLLPESTDQKVSDIIH